MLVKLVHTEKVATEVHQTPHRVTQLDVVMDVSSCLVAVGLLAVSYAGQSGLARVLLALAFTFFVPGRAIVTNWPQMAGWSGVAMPIVFSLALLTLVATVSLWAHIWYPMDLFQIEAWLSLAGLCFGVARRNRHRSDRLADQSEPWPWGET